MNGNINDVLLTSPLGTADKINRMVQLIEKSPGLLVVVDHLHQVELYQEAARSANQTLNVLVDIDVGDCRTGVSPEQPALELALTVDRSRNLNFRGLQAYSGISSHVVGFEHRRAHSLKVMSPVLETREQLIAKGLPVEILSGGSTGTYNIDIDLDGLTELQVGSYIYMDIGYHQIGGWESPNYEDFGFSLTVLTSVVSVNQNDQVTLDAGIKAFATDQTFGPKAKDLKGVNYKWKGDEFGAIIFDSPNHNIKLGKRLEFIVPHCDPTVNLYEKVYACRGEKVVEVWSIMDRLKNLQGEHTRIN